MPLRAGFAIASCLLGLVMPRRIVAQSPSERADLEQFRRLLAGTAASAAVRQLMAVSPAAQAGPVRDLRRGFALLRLGELTDDRKPVDEAIARFDDVQAKRPAWIYPWFGLALAKQFLHGLDALARSSRNQADGVNYYEGSLEAFKQVFARDSAFAPALPVLRRLLIEQGEKGQPEVLTRPIREVGLGPAGTADDALILAREFRRRDRGDSALIALDLYRRRGGDPGLERLERARTLAGLGAPHAASGVYLEGLSQITPVSRSALRSDLGWIATSGELASFDRTPDDSLADWITAFWHWRDVHELRQPGERLQEHLRRWAWVDTHFRVVSPERRIYFARMWNRTGGACDRGDYWVADNILGDSIQRPWDGRHRERLYDDRAYVYMRHGEPARRVRGMGAFGTPDEPMPPVTVRDNEEAVPGGEIPSLFIEDRLEDARANESWLYYFGGERRVFHFEGSKALGLGAPTTLAAEPLPDEGWLWARGELDPAYRRLAFELGRSSPVPFNCRKWVREVALKERSDAETGLRSDSYTLLFPKPLDPVVQMYALGRPDLGTGRILVVFALSGRQLAAHERDTLTPAGVWYPLTTRIGATDSAQRRAIGLDTTRNFLARDTIGAGAHLTGALELRVPAGRYDVGAAFFQADAKVGGSVERDGLDLRPGRDGLYLSDVVLGRIGSGLAWVYEGDSIPLNPLGAFPRGEAAQVFYELSGLVPGRLYSHQVDLFPIKDPHSKDRIRLRFAEVAADSALRVRRTLGLGELKPGQYRLVVEVRESDSSRRVSREQTLTIIE